MHDPAPVGLVETRCNRGADLQGFFDRESAPVDPLSEGLALVVGHRDECKALVRGVDLIDRADIWMVECGCRPGLVDEAFCRFSVTAQVSGKYLDRYHTVEIDVTGLVDYAHSAFADLFDYRVMRDRFAYHIPEIISRRYRIL